MANPTPRSLFGILKQPERERVIEYPKTAAGKTGKLAEIAKINEPSQLRPPGLKGERQNPLFMRNTKDIGGIISGFSFDKYRKNLIYTLFSLY
jgi:hypothetical protein